MALRSDEKPKEEEILDDEVLHIVCGCNEDIALCGLDRSGSPWRAWREPVCVVCKDLNRLPCPRCGR